MNDISKIQQVNSIARELIKHGQASSMEEATKLALQQVESGSQAVVSPAPPVSLDSPDSSAPVPEPAPEPSPVEPVKAEAPQPAAGSLSDQESAQKAMQGLLDNIEQQGSGSSESVQKLSLDNPEVAKEPEAAAEPEAEPEQEAAEEQPETVSEPVPAPEPTPVETIQTVTDAGTDVSHITSKVDAHAVRIDELHGKITSLIAEMTGLKEELRKLKENPVVAPPLKPKAAKEGQTQFKSEPQPVKPAEGKPSGDGHARTGNFNPDDVSIEKFFYCGTR